MRYRRDREARPALLSLGLGLTLCAGPALASGIWVSLVPGAGDQIEVTIDLLDLPADQYVDGCRFTVIGTGADGVERRSHKVVQFPGLDRNVWLVRLDLKPPARRVRVAEDAECFRGVWGGKADGMLTTVAGLQPGGARPLSARPAASYSEVGCFRDSQDRALGDALVDDPGLTRESCAAICSASGFPYAGVQWSRQCLCGRRYDRYGPANNCDMPCGGNQGQTCGGGWANSVLKVSPPENVPEPVGCYKDASDRAMGWGGDSDSMTIGKCVDICTHSAKRFAGLQFGKQCWCGDSYSRYGKADNCNMRCAGSALEICGGKWANSVYTVR